MQITGTHFNYYQICKRKLWLFANGINFEQTSDLVYEGKLIHESSYPQRSSKYEEVEIDAKQYNNKNYYFGDLIRVIKPSPMRVKNPCHANKECMGCNLLHYAYPAQLKHKKDLIKESLKSVSINI